MKKFLFVGVCLLFTSNSRGADQAGYDACIATIAAASAACTDASTSPSGSQAAYQSGQNAICDLNYHVIENVNDMFCFMRYQMAFDGAATGSATVSSEDYAWSYSTTGLESFATTQGYSKKLEVTKAGITQLVMWWDGTGDTTKGYMISNKVGITLSNELAIYIQWDKSTANQWVRYMRGTWTGTNSDGPMDANGGELNRGKYGYMSFNSDTNALAELEIVDVKGNGGDTSLMCEKNRIWGNTGGTLGIWSATGMAAGSSAVDTTSGSGGSYPVSTGVSGGALSDFTTTIDSISGPGNFSKSCADIYAYRAGGASNIFANNADSVRLDFSAVPATVFGSASP